MEEEKKEEKITFKKSTLWQITTFVFLALFVFSIFTGGFSDFGSKDTAPTGNTIVNPPTNQPKINMEDLMDDDPVKGDKNAPVTIIEFSDFECPFCGRFYTQTLSQIDEQYIKTGKVKLVFRDFPLSFHQYAQKSAEASECADDQGKFWEYHDLLFENQATLSFDNLKQWASDLNLDTAKFNDCLDSGKHEAEVKQDMKDGSAAGIRGTPGFVINGQLVSGAQPFSVFQQAIEAGLNQ